MPVKKFSGIKKTPQVEVLLLADFWVQGISLINEDEQIDEQTACESMVVEVFVVDVNYTVLTGC